MISVKSSFKKQAADLGLKESDLFQITEVLKKHPAVERACLFGSRAKGEYSHGADIDLCLFGEAVDSRVLNQIKISLEEETTVPYFFDVLVYDRHLDKQLKKEIDRDCYEIYQ